MVTKETIKTPEPKNLIEYLAETRKIIKLLRWISKEIWNEDVHRIFWRIVGILAICSTIDALVPYTLRMVFDALAGLHVSSVWLGFGFFVMLVFLKRCIRYLKAISEEEFFGVSQQRLRYRAGELFFSKSLGTHLAHDRLLSESNMKRGFEWTEQLQRKQLFRAVESGLNAIFPFIGLWWLSWRVGLLFTTMMTIYIVWSLYLSRQVLICNEPIEKRWRWLGRYQFERWHHVERVKTSGKEADEINKMNRTFSDILKDDFAFWHWYVVNSWIRHLVSIQLVHFAVVGWGINSVLSGELSLGWLYPLLSWSTSITDNLYALAEEEKEMNKAAPYVVAFKEALTLPNGIVEVINPKPLPKVGGYLIELKNIGHMFQESQGTHSRVLDNVSFTIEPGERVALIGPSGIGKTTLMRLLLRYMDPTEGQICINGIDLKDIGLNDWLTRIGYISQTPHIFDGTVRDNVIYRLPEEAQARVTDEEIWETMRMLQIDFGKRLHRGLNTRIGHNGIKLSGGQNQRLMILAAAISDPKFLVIDEATSSLDAISERLVQKGLEKVLEGDRGALIVTHRLPTVRRMCDKFVMLKNGPHGGHIAAIGSSFEDLADKSSEFRDLASHQDIMFT